jgi:HK97 family phage portal protein
VSILARLPAVLSGRGGQDVAEQRTLMSSAFVPPPQVGVIDDFVGVHRAMASMTVLACVRLLADTIASLPWKAYRKDANGVPVELDPQPAIIRQPWPGFNLFEWKWMVIASLALRGNSYHLVTSRSSDGYPTALLPLHPDIVFLERRPEILYWMDPIYRVMGEPVDAYDMVHIRRFTMPGEPWGLSPVRQAAVAIGMSLAAEEYGYRYFKESANPTGLLCTDQNLDDKAVARQQQNWIASHGGRRLPAILTGGFKWEQLSIRPDESQFLETRQFQRSEICIMFGVPPILIGDTKETTAWGTGVEQINRAAVTYSFRAWTANIESVISDLLPRGQYIEFDFDDLLRGDLEVRYTAYKTGIQAGFLAPDEVRAKELMEPIPGGLGKKFMQPTTMGPLGMDPTKTASLQAKGPMEKSPASLPSQPANGGENVPKPRNGTKVGAAK